MFLLNIALLFITLSTCKSMTSIEVFDDFDRVDLERPAFDDFIKNIEDIVGKSGKKSKMCVGNSSCPGTSSTGINSNTTTTENLLTSTNMYKNADVNTTNVTTETNQLNSTTFETSNNTLMNLVPALAIESVPFPCPEVEQPTNIGPYAVPTQRDMMMHVRNHLLAMYRGFHAQSLFFLKDVKQATEASWARKMLCHDSSELMHYRRCVRWVADLSVQTTKSLMTALETARHQINSLIQGKSCNMTALSVDPIHLIRILAAEKVSLEFALPDFLRQLNDCARHCPSAHPKDYLKNARLTDEDFVIRHYLTQENIHRRLLYVQQYKI